jgi:glycogen(starch) synthase
MECIVRGIPAITSDLSGFGDYVMQNFPDHDRTGMYVARRRYASFHNTVGQVTNWIHHLAHMKRRERIDLRNHTEAHAEAFDWNNLGKHYTDAHQMALERRFGNKQTTATPRKTKQPRSGGRTTRRTRNRTTK